MSKDALYVETYGFKAMEEYFKSLSNTNEQAKIVMASFRKATKPLVDLAQSTVPVKTGNLKKSIGFVPLKNNMPIACYVGARIRRGYKGYHGHIVNDGTFDRFRKTMNNAPTGRMKVNGFFRKAAAATEQRAIDTVASEWYKAIARHRIKAYKD